VAGADNIYVDAPREATLKGISGRHRLFPVRWQ
jgi:hypothetical protein